MEQENEKKASLGLKIVSFLIPLVGLIVFLCNISKRPKYAKGCGIAALIGFVLYIILPFVFTILLGFTINNTAKETLEDAMLGTNMSSEIVEIYNSKFETYKGNGVTATKVRNLITTVKNNNLVENEMQITIFVDGEEMEASKAITMIEKNKTYNVTMSYSKDGYVNKIKITSNI